MIKSEPNELHPELLSISALNPWFGNDSSSRLAMVGSHLGQFLVVKGTTQRLVQTGIEKEFGKYTFNIRMPADGEVLEIIDRYAPSIGHESIRENPQTLVIYEDIHTKEIGMVSLTGYCSNHQYFGFKYQAQDGLKHLHVGARIPKDTIFMDSPNIDEDGTYKYGVQANIALMTHPATSEDGVLICRDFLPKLGFKTFETRVVEWGSKQFALNLYGDKDHYKPFPDIGDCIRKDGVLMALRDYEPGLLAAVEQGVQDCQEVDYTFDSTIYANGPGGRIVDIRIHHDLANAQYSEVQMDSQPLKYDSARRIFYGKIVSFWRKMHKKRGEALQLTPELHRLVVEALSVVNEQADLDKTKKPKVAKLYRQTPLDDYRVEFVIEYDVVPNIGFKISDLHGTAPF